MGYARTGRNHRPAKLQRVVPPADRETYRRHLDGLAESVTARLMQGPAADQLADQIRAGMAELRACRTPAERAAVEAKIRPLIMQRQMWTPWAV